MKFKMKPFPCPECDTSIFIDSGEYHQDGEYLILERPRCLVAEPRGWKTYYTNVNYSLSRQELQKELSFVKHELRVLESKWYVRLFRRNK